MSFLLSLKFTLLMVLIQAWEGKTCNCREEKLEIQRSCFHSEYSIILLTLPLLFLFSAFVTSLHSYYITSPPDERCWWIPKTEIEQTRTLARQSISIKCCVCVYSHLATPPELQQGCVLFREFPKSRSVTLKQLCFFFLLFSPILCSLQK